MSEKNTKVREAAKTGWNTFIEMDEAKGFVPLGISKKNEDPKPQSFDGLTAFEKFGLYAAVSAMIEDPLAEPYASYMPANHDRKEYRALDNCLRDALGYARYDHQ